MLKNPNGCPKINRNKAFSVEKGDHLNECFLKQLIISNVYFQTDKMRLLDSGGVFLRHPPVFYTKFT